MYIYIYIDFIFVLYRLPFSKFIFFAVHRNSSSKYLANIFATPDALLIPVSKELFFKFCKLCKWMGCCFLSFKTSWKPVREVQNVKSEEFNVFKSRITLNTKVHPACLHTQKMKFSIKDFLGKCDQICIKLRISTLILKKSLIANFIFCEVFLLIRLAKIKKRFLSILLKRCINGKAFSEFTALWRNAYTSQKAISIEYIFRK